MATITASSVSTTDSLETFRQRFNTLRSDIQGLSFGSSIVFEGATADDYETTLTITDPTADRTVTIQNKTGILAMQGRDISDVVVMNASDGSGTDEAGAILLNASASGVDEGEALIYEDGTGDHIVNPTFEEYEEFIILEESTENGLVFLTRENTDESSVNARFAYQAATSDNLLGSLFIPPSAGGVQFTMPVSDGDNDQVLATDGSGNLSFKNQSSGMSLSNDANNRVVTATGSGSGNGEANLTFDGSTLVITGAVDLSGAFDTDGVASAATFEPDGDTSAGDAAAIGYTAALGLILTGQGSTNDVTIVNDADATVLSVATGGTDVDIVGDVTAATLNADGDTSAGDNAAIGYTSGEGLILTGQGSTSDITLKNDADETVFTVPTGTDDILFPDSAKAMFGAGSDLSIYHDGSHSYIHDSGTGSLIFRTNQFTVRNVANDENMIAGTADGAVQLSYDNSTKLATTSTGIQITGTAVVASTTYAPISRRGEDVFIVLDQTAAGGTDAGDNVIMDRSAGDGTDAGDDIIGEDEVFLHSGMQRNVLNIFNSGGTLLNSVAGFAPGAI